MTSAVPEVATTLVPAGAHLLLIFDGWCGVCTRTVDWIKARDPAGHVAALPNQTPDLLERAGLTRDQVDREVWAIDRRGRRYAGAAAINRVLAELPRWRRVAPLYRIPGIRQSQTLAYRWFAANRGQFFWLGTTPACRRPGVLCRSERGVEQ